MSAYLPAGPDGPEAAFASAAVLAATLILALLVTRLPWTRVARVVSWALGVGSLLAIDRITRSQPAGLRMLVLIAALLFAMKAVVSVEAFALDGTRLPPLRWLAFATLWPGMRPGLFARLQPRRAGAWPLVARGLGHLAIGIALVILARAAWGVGSEVLATLALLPALSLLLHFGAFDVLAGLWRLAGADVSAPFRAPLRATSLGEFWSRRWNIPFSEMTALVVYRPVSKAAGSPAGLFTAFLFSGLLHEVAISLPVRAGFGAPLLYFALHGLLVGIERARGPLGRWGALVSLVVPLPLLFHSPFLHGVLWPLLGSPG
jgi:membrane bound O-acyltransferase family protein